MALEYLAVVVTILVAVASSVPLGRYVFRVFAGERTFLDPLFVPVERLVLRAIGVEPGASQDWKRYVRSLLVSNAVLWLVTFTVVVLQKHLPLNPDGIGNMEPTLAFNTISSFVTNTNLQHYSGETGLSYFSQMFVITFLQFVTAATGIAACIATIRGLAGGQGTGLGNFYVDATRGAVRVLLPLALLVGGILLWQGTPMTFAGAIHATTVEGGTQTIARGVTAPEVAIKQLGTNGGGYFGTNSAHPYENPTPLASLVEQWAILVIPMAMVWTLGAFTRRPKLAVMLFAVMLALYLPMVAFAVGAGGARQPGGRGSGRRSVDRVDGGQGGARRRRPVRPVGREHHRDVERLGQCHARFADAARRPDADGRHVAQ